MGIRRFLPFKRQERPFLNLVGPLDKEGSIKVNYLRQFWQDSQIIEGFGVEAIGTRKFKKRLIGLSGWIVGKNTRFSAIEIFSGPLRILSVPVDIDRPDVMKRFGLSGSDMKLGFCGYFNPVELAEKFDLDAFAVASSGEKVKVFSIGGQRKQLGKHMAFKIKPLLVTTLGRTGSTYLLGLLAAHPSITAYRPFEVEARYASYWTQIFLSLSHPKSWLCPVASYDLNNSSWVFGSDEARTLHYALYPDMFEWFDGFYIENLYRFCMQNLQEHYLRVAEIQGKKDVSFFTEKFLPNPFTEIFRNLIPEAKEIILVRDFRDVFCSIKAFNAKRGFLAFGRDRFDSDEDYVAKSLSEAASALVRAWKRRQSRSILVRYEDLIREPESTLSRIFDYLNIDTSRATVKNVVVSSSRVKPRSQSQHKTTSSALDSIGRFRKELDPDFLELCNQAFKEALETFGYPL